MDQEEFQGIERRSYLRVSYDHRERPLLHIGIKSYEVIDLSEGGIRFFSKDESTFDLTIEGKLDLLDNEPLVIHGSIEWIEENQVGFV